MNKIIDTHAHYDDEAFEEDRESLLEELKRSEIELVVDVAATVKSLSDIMALVDKHDFIYGALGVHPSETKDLTESILEDMREKTKHKKIVAIGEIGLDYYWDDTEREVQKTWFIRQMELAREEKLPIIIHSRDAAKDTYDIMKAVHAEEIGGVIHCFSYSVEEAKKYLDMGFYLGIGGVVTFNNAKKLKEVVEYAPLERLVLETDCPYLAPVPNRGKRNDSRNLVHVVKQIASLKQIEEEIIIEATNKNAKQLYRMEQR